MRRPELIAGLGGAAVWPLAARAQRAALAIIDRLLDLASLRPFLKGLRETGWVEGQNVAIEYRRRAQDARIPAFATARTIHGNDDSRMSVRNAGA
jgi:putative ABC transport system substrate-binding protein